MRLRMLQKERGSIRTFIILNEHVRLLGKRRRFAALFRYQVFQILLLLIISNFNNFKID